MLNTEPSGVSSILNWMAAIGAVIGGTIAGYFGTRSARSKLNPSGESPNEELMRLRAKVSDDELRRDLELVIKATRDSLATLIEQNHQFQLAHIERFGQLVAALERRVLILELERGHKPGDD